MRIAERVARLGTETAFAVSAEAKRRDTAVGVLNSIDGVRCFRPNATFYLYPNVIEAMRKKGLTNYDDFHKTFLGNTNVL